VNVAFARARAYGVAIRFADLGDWGTVELRSEYDPRRREIRLNARVAERLNATELGKFVVLAIAHELYHHRERIGEIPVLRDATARERAADAYARETLHER
jgi:hypothetical protein